MRILLTNDDGIDAPGLRALADCLAGYCDAVIVAPADQKSACSHSISLGQDLYVEKREGGPFPQYAVYGTPADSVKFAVSELQEFSPQLLLSGINQGANTGVSVYYSGTISAAREGQINKIPSVAFSLCSRTADDFSVCQGLVRRVVAAYEKGVFPGRDLLNFNIPAVPASEIRGIRVTKQAASRFIEEFIKHNPRDHREVYTLAGEIEIYDNDGSSDEEAVAAGFISLTPLRLDLTDYEAMPRFEKWIQSFQKSADAYSGKRKPGKAK